MKCRDFMDDRDDILEKTMTRILLFGAMGAMGRNVINCAKAMEDVTIVAGVDREDH